MKPITLTMTAFGPYKDKEIVDFRDLKDHRLFVISGKTGAGKKRLHLPGVVRARGPSSVREVLEGAGLSIESAELSMVPKSTVVIDEESTAKRVVRLIDGLEEQDDVQDVYSNFDIPEAVLEAVVS